jgi:hypothetical protein
MSVNKSPCSCETEKWRYLTKISGREGIVVELKDKNCRQDARRLVSAKKTHILYSTVLNHVRTRN